MQTFHEDTKSYKHCALRDDRQGFSRLKTHKGYPTILPKIRALQICKSQPRMTLLRWHGREKGLGKDSHFLILPRTKRRAVTLSFCNNKEQTKRRRYCKGARPTILLEFSRTLKSLKKCCLVTSFTTVKYGRPCRHLHRFSPGGLLATKESRT